MMSEKNAILICVDDAYVPPSLALVVSLAATQRGHPRVVVVHSGLSRGNVNALRILGVSLGLRLTVTRIPRPREDLPVTGHASLANYLRLLAPCYLEDYETLLYLDADTLVLRDLAGIWNSLKTYQTLGAVRDHFHPTIQGGGGLPGYDGKRPHSPYFNSGVMLINRRAWVRSMLSDRCLQFIRNNPQHIRFWDQDALNAILEGRWVRLSPAYNAFPFSDLLPICGWEQVPEQTSASALWEVEHKAFILHFVGSIKPWHAHYPLGRNRSLYRRLAAEAQRRTGVLC